MLFKSLIAALAIATPLVTATGNATVINECDFEVTLWSVGSQINGPHQLEAEGGSYSEKFVVDALTGGKALKVTRNRDGLYTGEPQTIYAYSLDGDNVWYDLSNVFGDAFAGNKLVVQSANEDCGAIVWEDGTAPAGSQVKVCTASEDVTFTLCA
ncbi:hypothetical protein SODALDRAFT_188305 [Sodiomyces alkalinus F11]|uniref:Bys1 family protein n=1 Tax=Sodiomyces alkalinus (strain CBS 110278 / VKM F-3762 / F11) TaxID=1314773 RepID=A0A3N2PRK0_SODAK|nr:hypothetical protein SODALDRAFT_188305 [Sodiomyces alkalinus F11]ROT37108.1 hypothetical protein SODALDRAFT_188305 [Sodiomyces alkalinus F11]